MKKLIALFILFSFCFPANAQIVRVRPIHPAVSKTKPPPPDPGYVWIEGDWRYSSRRGRYAWMPAHWTKPLPGQTWQPGYWLNVAGGYKWISGHWVITKGGKKK